MKEGGYVIDTRDGRIGQVMGREGPCLQLRPPGGGREWDCPPEALAPAPPGEVLRARVRALNRETLAAASGAGPRPVGMNSEGAGDGEGSPSASRG